MKYRKQLIILVSSLLFILGVYIGALTFYSINMVISINKSDLDTAAKRAGQLLNLTSGISNLDIYPIEVITNTSEMIISVNDLRNSGSKVISGITSGGNTQLSTDYSSFQTDYINTITKLRQTNKLTHDPQFLKWMKLIGKQDQAKSIREQVQQILTSMEDNQDIISIAPDIIGIDNPDPITYTILLQNNLELRPTGGFMGSYVQLTFDQGNIKNLEAQDIYVPDGAIQGHVNPPDPIQQAFKQGWWRLRDSNWDPDFPTSTQAISWFFDKGGVDVGQGIIAINLEVVEDILNEMGAIALPDYDKEITAQNLYAVTQYEAERDFFAGSTQKKDFIQSLVNNIFYQKNALSATQLHHILTAITKHLTQKNIQFHMEDPQIQSIFENKNWAGTLDWNSIESANNDFFYSVDANLGANKANCCIEKTVTQNITQDNSKYTILTIITYTNKSPVPTPKPPKYWGGDYENYTRIYIPTKAKVENIDVSNNPDIDHQVALKDRDGVSLTEYGFFVNVPHQETVTVTVTHTLPKNDDFQLYATSIKRQSGIPPYPHNIQYTDPTGSTLEKNLTLDQDYVVKF